MLVKKDKRIKIKVPESDAVREILTSDLRRNMVLLLACLPPGRASSRGFTTHLGEECVFLLRGVIAIHLPDGCYTLGAGDSFYFPASQPHYCTNPGSTEAEFLSVIVPPTLDGHRAHSTLPVHGTWRSRVSPYILEVSSTTRWCSMSTILERLACLPSATVSDVQRNLPMTYCIDPAIRCMVPGVRVAGPAFTVLGRSGSIISVHKGLLEAPPGAILVVGVRPHNNRTAHCSESSWRPKRVCPTSWDWSSMAASAEEAMAVIGLDWHPSGVEPNRRMIQALGEEEYAQHLVQQPIDSRMVFADLESVIKA